MDTYRKICRAAGPALAIMLLLGGCSGTKAAENPGGVQTQPENTAQAETAASASPSDGAGAVSATGDTSEAEGAIVLADHDGIVLSTVPRDTDTLERHITVDVRGERSRTFQWNAIVDASRPPVVEEADVNEDGVSEIVIVFNTGTGTGLAINELHVLNPATLEELEVEDPVQTLNDRLNSTIEHRSGRTYVDAELDGRHVSRMYDYTEGAWGRYVGFGSIVYYGVEDGRLTANLSGQASMTEFPVHIAVKYGSDLKIAETALFNGTFLQAPLDREDLRHMTERWLGKEGWELVPKDGQFSIQYAETGDGGQPLELMVNPDTGTVHDAVSGSPLTNLADREAPDLLPLSNGTAYQAELEKLAVAVLDAAGLKPAGREWITGFAGDGYVLAGVQTADRTFEIKLDVFTGQWEAYGG